MGVREWMRRGDVSRHADEVLDVRVAGRPRQEARHARRSEVMPTEKPKKPVRWRDTCGHCSKRRMVEELCGDQVCRECMPDAERDAAGVALEPHY